MPLIFLQNLTGFIVGKDFEQAGMIKKGSQFINAVSNSTVPHVTVIVRQVNSKQVYVIGEVARQGPYAIRGEFRIVDALSSAGGFGAFAGREELLKDNAGLRREIDRLKLALAAARVLEDENKSLRFLLNAGRRRRGRHIATRVIGDPGGVFVRSLIVNSGKRDGVRKGRAVVNGQGLIGRITGVGERSARVLLITDLNSRIPVRITGTRNRAILAGRNSDELKLQYLPRNAKIKVGAKVVTSGHGGVLPPGLPIGTVSKSDGRRVFVRANVDWNRLEFVQIVDYAAPGVVLPNRIDGVAAPRHPRKKKARGETASR